MIVLKDLTKIYTLNGRHNTVLDNANVVFPTGRSVALLGRNGAGKSSLLRMIAGIMLPTSGTIYSDGSISWPVGFKGSFHRELTGEQNCRFVARVYGVDTREVQNFVEAFAELGPHFKLPVRSYSSGMMSRLAFGLSMAIPFDTYLVDEVTAVGDASFKKKSNAVFKERMERSSAIVVSHSNQTVKTLCDMAMVLEDGVISVFDDVEEGLDLHMANMEKDRR